MRSSIVRRLIVIAAILALPFRGYAQEAAVSGTVTDTTGGAMPGVTVTAVHEATGNTFEAVTDERGAYRLPVRVGIYRLTAELPGFTTVTQGRLELLVGQTALVNLQMAPSSVQETVTVTGEVPLIDVTSSTLAGNIDPRQMQELPVNGRNWIDLTMLAPGSRQNASSETPTSGFLGSNFQINIDGQQVTQLFLASFGQPRYSREGIAEFEFVSNRFDATQGRSSGVQVNAITKSGTNTRAGSFSGYFRDDSFNAADFIERRVLPYSNQQLAGTFGGPIRKDRAHFFVNYEHEREPQTFSHPSPWPSFNIDLAATRVEKKGGVRLDFQFSPQTRLSVRGNKHVSRLPIDPRYSGGASRHPSTGIETTRYSNHLQVTLTQVFGNRALNEIRAGYAGYYWIQDPVVRNWANHPYGLKTGSPIIGLRGYAIGQGHSNSRQVPRMDPYSIRNDFTVSLNKAGRHAFKVGGEYIYMKQDLFVCSLCMGFFDALGGPPPANLEALFPVWNDVSTWNIAALSPIIRFYDLGIGEMKVYPRRHNYAAWVQDDWAIAPRLMLNLGLRYDLGTGNVDDVGFPPFLEPGRSADKNDVAPRLGFAYGLNDRTVVRGGYGKYFENADDNAPFWTLIAAQTIQPRVLNDGLADFVINPFNGPAPTYEEAVASGKHIRSTQPIQPPQLVTPYSHQTSIGVQRQLLNTISLEADYVYTGVRAGLNTRNINVAYDPATGANYPFTDRSKKPYAGWEQVIMRVTDNESNYHALQVAFTKRMSNGWQASATYLLAGQWNLQPAPVNPGCQQPMTMPSPGVFRCDVPIQLHPVLAEEWYLSEDQRHRAVFNGIWALGYGFQLSGLYFYGDNGWQTPISGVDVLQAGFAGGRLRPNGTLIPRRSFDRSSLHRVDLRVQRRFRLGARAAIDGILEVFNLFNHENYGSFVTNESNRRYGQPSFNGNVAYQPRILQLGFRSTF